MLLTAIVTKDELAALASALGPLRITLDEQRGRSVTLGRLRLDLVSGRGLRLRGDARLRWDVAGMSVPVTLEGFQVLLTPRFERRAAGPVLLLEPVLEELGLKHVPGFLDGKIAGALRDGVARNQHKLAWSLARALGRSLPVPRRFDELAGVRLVPTDASVTVTSEALELRIALAAAVERRSDAPVSSRRAVA